MLPKRSAIAIFAVACLLAAGGVVGISSSLANQPDYGGLHKPDPAERAKAVQEIRAAQDVAAVPLLLKQLNDPDAMVGLYIAQTLGDLATDRDLEELRAGLSNPDANVRFRAALALGKRRDVAATYALTRAVRDPDVLVQRTAAEALAAIGTPEAVDSLVAALNSSQDSIIQVTMNALQSVGEGAVTGLNAALKSHNPLVRKNAATALGYIKSANAAVALKAATADPDAAVAQEAAWALAEIEKRR